MIKRTMNSFNGTLDIYLASAGTGKTTKLLAIIDSHLNEKVLQTI